MKHLDAVAPRIRCSDCPLWADGNGRDTAGELSRAGAAAAEGKEKVPRRVEDLDAIVVAIRHDYLAIRPDCHVVGGEELSRGIALTAEGEEKRPRRVEDLDATVERVRHDDSSV